MVKINYFLNDIVVFIYKKIIETQKNKNNFLQRFKMGKSNLFFSTQKFPVHFAQFFMIIQVLAVCNAKSLYAYI